jgi:hypothetical protein
MPDTKIPPRVEDPGHWRFRADNTRKLASESKDPNAKTILLNVAEQFERLARLAEERQRQTPAKPA